MEIETKELAVVKAQATKALTAAQGIMIVDQPTLEQATDLLSRVKSVGKMIKERKEAITKPLNEALSSARDLFRPIEESHAEAERVIKTKMLEYQAAEDKKRREAEAKIAAQVEAGKIKTETAIRKTEALPQVPVTAKGKVGQISTRIVKKVQIVDEMLIPREYLTPNTTLINEAVLKQGKQIPGVQVVEEKVIAAR